MPSKIQKANLPISPFDGQEYVDFRGLKWQYSASDNCWKSAGVSTSSPLASAEDVGLLSPAFKQLLDSLPERAGGFGILTAPLLSVVPTRRKPIYRGVVTRAYENASGSQIQIDAKVFTPNSYDGKLIFFTSGALKTKYYLIFTNSDDTLYIMGKEASVVNKGDHFEIIDAAVLNEHGVIQGDIQLVSETLDIGCVTGSGEAINAPDGCSVDRLYVDDPVNPPGLDIKVNKKFLDQFCVAIPGSAGPDGDRGDKGDQGADGTGDGPKGEAGDPGVDAPETGHKLTGVKINDIDDVYDTAVVGFELDAQAGKLHVIKAKIKVPDDDTPAQRVIANAINRNIYFTNEQFAYDLMMPAADPIGSADVNIMNYPQGFTPPEPASLRPSTYQPNVTPLSRLVDALISHYQIKLDGASIAYDNKIKPFIEEKDDEARKILAELADDVAKCEWEAPIEFCLGISPEKCSPDEGAGEPTPLPLAENLLGEDYKNGVGKMLGQYTVRPGPGGGPGDIPLWSGAMPNPPSINVPPPTPGPMGTEPNDPNPPSPPPSSQPPAGMDPTLKKILDWIAARRKQIDNLTAAMGEDAKPTYLNADGYLDIPVGNMVSPNGLVSYNANTGFVVPQYSSPAVARGTANYSTWILDPNGGGKLLRGPMALIFKYMGGWGAGRESSVTSRCIVDVYNAKTGELLKSEEAFSKTDEAAMWDFNHKAYETAMRSSADTNGLAIEIPDGLEVNVGVSFNVGGITSAYRDGPGVTFAVYQAMTPDNAHLISGLQLVKSISDPSAAPGSEPGPSPLATVVISDVTPSSHTPAGGQMVTVTGSGFDVSGLTVTVVAISPPYNSTTVTPLTVTPTQVMFSMPNLPADTYTLQITTDGGSDNAPNCFVVSVPQVVITSLTPSTISSGTSNTIYIGGTGFTTSGQVYIGTALSPLDIELTAQAWCVITSWTDTNIQLVINSGHPPIANYILTVNNEYNESNYTAPLTVT